MNYFCLVVFRTLCVAWHVLSGYKREYAFVFFCFCFFSVVTGTSLVVQWLRIHLAVQGTRVQSLVGELRSHMPRSD